MSQVLNYGGEMLRITSKGVECSTDGGLNWRRRCSSSSFTGDFIDLFQFGAELLAVTTQGLYCSTDGGLNWRRR
ncbi:MAG: hypothetical protein K2J12_08935, partial [Muribaculaceae bacterium]|nr:hypothetical protein [Muribaculaceae bacterium]